ncbi:carbon storage regulator CsrA [Paramaledivibacter caminithermalis]|jgi:carbon storage regulator|uniref:Translational regulator CsrA n=1 Tax=Paramaledivibacter caminithermalis (strain DSM 15212 / CIP 107654 / DViRD3) TaxID=1121301 RepID=A0A1M6L5S4_PARC5|nr:carbon storage regulator CsrA [Paramaledivibacter caminithermalis]SHJ66550.1 carbon storage regulator, CsrA [Paramaledivibacter caminithermalis DSM 15212]
MLILTRKLNESLMIGDNIEIKVIKIEEGKVRIGISAPKNIDIHRKEVYDMIVNENKKASDIDIEYEKLQGLFKINEKLQK